MQYAGFKYCRVMMKHGRTEAVQEEPKVLQSPNKEEEKVRNCVCCCMCLLLLLLRLRLYLLLLRLRLHIDG